MVVLARACAFSSLISTMPFFGPGTAPLTSSRLFSTSISCTCSPTWVTRLPPRRPAIFIPLKTRDGVAEAPIEPGLRMLCEPCVFGPRWKRCRLIVPAKPLPIPIPVTLIESPGWNDLDRDRLAEHGLALTAELDEVAVRVGAALLQVPELRLRDLALGDRLEGELDGLVAVGLDGLHLDDRAGAGLDHRDRRDDARLSVEELSHSELSSDDPFISRYRSDPAKA